MAQWILTTGLLAVCSLSAFAIGFVLGGDAQRERQRLAKIIADEKLEHGAEPDWLVGGRH